MLDEPGIATLYQQYAPAIFAYLLQHMRSEEDAEDILVEVFLAALENEQFPLLAEKAQLAWLWRVARNKMIDVYRRSVRRQSVTLEHIAESINDDDGIDPEIAAHMGKREGAVKVMLSRALNLLKNIYKTERRGIYK
jgi:RNA polymerase sigma-70 factor (ECF subfamily)